jgi:hypothetical protein
MDWVQIGSLLIGVLIGLTMLKGAAPLARRFAVNVRFWLRHGRKGRTLLFVYSDSPNWKDYVETHIVPRIETRSIILNWSKRREWGPQMHFEAKLFDQLAGPGAFVPVAILFSLMDKPRTFRLWQPSENAKQGKVNLSREVEEALLQSLKLNDR